MWPFIQNEASKIGFHLCGVTSDFTPRKKAYFLKWLNDKKQASMDWLAKNVDKRLAPNLLMEDAKCVLTLAVSYKHEPPKKNYRVARYAYGEDYHRWMKHMLEDLALAIQKKVGDGFRWRGFVDTGPVLERDLTRKAGLGWIGKNTCLLNERLGSCLFLGVIFINQDLTAAFRSKVSMPNLPKDQCASCRLCLEACPTGALTPYQLDASKCLSYHNIEHRGPRDPEYAGKMGPWLVGCDICQEVCPWNQSAPDLAPAFWRESFSRFDLGELADLKSLEPKSYKKKLKHSAISRIRFEDFQRNVDIVWHHAGSGEESFEGGGLPCRL